MRNTSLFPSKDAEEPSFTFELLLLSIFGWPLMLLVCRVFRLPEEWNFIIWLFYPIIFFIPIILIYLIIKNNYYKPVLLEISLIIFIIMYCLQRRNPNQERYWKSVIKEEKSWRWLYYPLEKIDAILLKLTQSQEDVAAN